MRDLVADFVYRELVGPDPVLPHVQENGEEILVNEPPRLRYGAGVLFPRSSSFRKVDQLSNEDSEVIEENQESYDMDDDSFPSNEQSSTTDRSDDYEEEIGLANNFLPAAMGFSTFVNVPNGGFKVDVRAAKYEIRDYPPRQKRAYFRIPYDQTVVVDCHDDLRRQGHSVNIELKDSDNNGLGLRLNIRNRTHGKWAGTNVHLLTFTLVNDNMVQGEVIRNEDCFFQVSFSVEATDGSKCFTAYDTNVSSSDTEDELSNFLLYRHKKTFAVGHGCSAEWDDGEVECVGKVTLRNMPTHEIKPIVPSTLKHVSLSMFDLCDLSQSDVEPELIKLIQEYEEWIDHQTAKASAELSGDLLKTANRHLRACKDCLARMKSGLRLLQSDTMVMKAFRLMNRAMLLQQLHYNIDLRSWNLQDGVFVPNEGVVPSLDDRSTWSPWLGTWRPFQLAFILMNLISINDGSSDERDIVDLIWFPTGGGKTEAYLGLAAFTIFLKRFKDPRDSGTTVLMRYTLRLLTAQQFQRAASLICACDRMRAENPGDLGRDRITIGLWVGESLTPNKRADARHQFRKMEQGQQAENPFIILKCPWCGTQMGLVEEGRTREIKGYRRRAVNGLDTIVYLCSNSECEFSEDHNYLPAVVIDEDIYDNPPTLLIGTVDKFAMLTWKPEARSIFGFRGDDTRLSPPELIIQDELHLISGPLGSMVGLYETLIEELCTVEDIRPKIVASTATISRAKQQINSLYGRGADKVSVFPPQYLKAGDSFFAYEDSEAAGRKYLGVFASALPSHATTQVRVISSLLQSIKSISSDVSEKDPYWTLLMYFNSLRELGHAATLIRADIREYMNSMWIRKGIRGNERRFINKDIELTSRINNSQIPEYLEMLSRSYPDEQYPVDICLATNMVSVGVDIQRLGLMLVVGQPKTTSEYIQATSRVGRSRSGPGLVLTVYNCSKPRDRSHYEQFQSYHSKIYSHVEPTSVTPFSAPARERALHSVIVGLIRLLSAMNRDTPKPFPDQELVNRVKKIICDRVTAIDPDELERTENLIMERLNYWRAELPPEYGSFGTILSDPLMYPAGSNPPEDIRERAWATPTSMRNVDATCDAQVVSGYINIDDN